MVNIMREVMSRVDDGRSLLRSIYNMEADLILDEQCNELTVKLHYPANHSEGKIIAHLCDELSSAEIEFPGTKMKVIYKLGTS